MKMTIQNLIATLLVGLVATAGGCASETVETSTLVCTPGEKKCDETSTKILECHPSGAAWALVSYCSVDAFCVNAVCTGEGTSAFEGQGNPEGTNTTSITEINTSQDTKEPDDDSPDTEEADGEEPPADVDEEPIAEDDSSTEEGGDPDTTLEEREERREREEEEEGGGERRNVILFEDDFTATEAGPAASSPNWVSHYCDDPWLMGSGYSSPQTDDMCKIGDETCLLGLGFSSIDTEFGEILCSESPMNNYVTALGQPSWNEYSLSARFITWDNDTLGVILGFQDPANFYLLTVSNDKNPLDDMKPKSSVIGTEAWEETNNPSIMLFKVSGDVELGENEVELLMHEAKESKLVGYYSTGIDCEIVASVFGTSIQAWIKCEDFEWNPIVDYQFENANPDTPGLPGSFGLYSYGTGLSDLSCESGQCGFLGVTVTTFPFDVVVD
jgi:hypothetical protein